jgi:hypothetical protein
MNALCKARKAKVAIRELKQAVNKPESNGAGTAERAAHTVELLDEEPLTMRRPITLLDGKAYAAIWPIVRITMTESAGKDGEVVTHDPPVVIAEPSLMVVSEEGGIFGIGHEPMESLGITIKLLEKIPAEKAWSTPGVKAYRNGHRPDPKNVFCRMADVIDKFIDFDRSLADQRTMAEMCACYALATWFLDAFNVIGFLWPSGDRGSGKTQLLTVLPNSLI